MEIQLISMTKVLLILLSFFLIAVISYSFKLKNISSILKSSISRSSLQLSSSSPSSSSSTTTTTTTFNNNKKDKKKILVLGGTGFVGRTFIRKARDAGHTIISLSRRGKLDNENDNGVIWLSGDATSSTCISNIINEYQPDSCFHCIGLLLDGQSGLASINKYASGSGSIPGEGSSYDLITRQTCFNAINSMETLYQNNRIPFVFVSAAEAGWTFKAPVDFLERYLTAKRAVEKKIIDSNKLKGVILRPSLIWTPDRPQAVISVLPFFIGYQLGLPFVDKPIRVEQLVDAALMGIEDDRVSGIKRFKEMEELSNTLNIRRKQLY